MQWLQHIYYVLVNGAIYRRKSMLSKTMFTLWSKVSLNITVEYDSIDLINISWFQIFLYFLLTVCLNLLRLTVIKSDNNFFHVCPCMYLSENPCSVPMKKPKIYLPQNQRVLLIKLIKCGRKPTVHILKLVILPDHHHCVPEPARCYHMLEPATPGSEDCWEG